MIPSHLGQLMLGLGWLRALDGYCFDGVLGSGAVVDHFFGLSS